MIARTILALLFLSSGWHILAGTDRLISAQDLVGNWVCMSGNNDRPLQWQVRQDMPKGWLVGEASRDGVVLATEGWSYDEHGRLLERRQFAADGVFVHMKTLEVNGSVMISEGVARDNADQEVRYRHTIERSAPDLLFVRWETINDESVVDKIAINERCSRI